MKPFESSLADRMEQYIFYRRDLGYSEKNLRVNLRAFDRYVCEHQADLADLTALFFLELKKSLRQQSGKFNTILPAVRGFFAYLDTQTNRAAKPAFGYRIVQP
jgi:integrase/recombinase XerD